MTVRCAIINLDTNTVENVVDYDALPVGIPPGFEGKFLAVADDRASPGWGWDGSKTFDPNPPVVVATPQTILSQDLMAQFTDDDAGKIQAAVAGNVQFWLLWQSLTTQKDPMLVSNARFLKGWRALVQVLGQPRMDAIAVALNVTIG